MADTSQTPGAAPVTLTIPNPLGVVTLPNEDAVIADIAIKLFVNTNMDDKTNVDVLAKRCVKYAAEIVKVLKKKTPGYFQEPGK